MSYFRIYPSKNNTIFRVLNNSNYENLNSGANPVMELRDGKSESKLLFRFEFPQWLQNRLNVPFTCKLQLWDAGTLFQPAIKLKKVQLSTFDTDFAEGDGYSFTLKNGKAQISNWKNALEDVKWEDVPFSPLLEYNLNNINEDLNFDVTSAIGLSSVSFALNVSNHEDEADVYTKFIHSKYTKTVFQPYLEFFIDDAIKDKSLDCYATKQNRIYLLNQTGQDFVGTLTATVQHERQVLENAAVTKERTGVYYITITPPMVQGMKEASLVAWSINGTVVKKEFIKIKSPNQFEEQIDLQNVHFYPTTPYTHNIVRQGDIIPFTIVSEIRGKTDAVVANYEYRITQADGFEMTPWTQCSVYRDKMYFNVNTEYFFPEQQYEVWLRNKTNDFTITSNLTHKFKLAQNDKSHMRELSASPYYSREIFLGK